MTDLTGIRANIQAEEVAFRKPAGESIFKKMGQSVNFINDFQITEKQFFLNGCYRVFYGQQGIDGLVVFEYDAIITNIYCFNIKAGTGSYTELDLLTSSTPGGSFASMFTPGHKARMDFSSGDNLWMGLGPNVLGSVPPVLITNQVNAGQACIIALTNVQDGDPQNCGMLIHYKPR